MYRFQHSLHSIMQVYRGMIHVLKCSHFMAVMDGVFCLNTPWSRVWYTKVRCYQSLRLSWVRLWALITLQTL